MKEICVGMGGNMCNRDDIVRKHRDMWNWIADMSEETGEIRNKEDYIKSGHDDLLDSDQQCYACSYADKVLYEVEMATGVCQKTRCKYCPFVWPDRDIHYGNTCCIGASDDFLYDRWVSAYNMNDVDECICVAREIANLPVSPLTDEEMSIQNG